jgi:prophage antirepressor-like protein
MSNNLLQIVDNSLFEGKTVRITGSFENPWFVVRDVCAVLGLSNVTEATRNIPEKWRGSEILKTPSGDQHINIINEAGLYKLILRSNKEIATKFQEWVCGEVLPSLRKKGVYQMNEEYQQKLKELENEKMELENEKMELIEEKENAEKLLSKKDEQIKLLQRETQIVDGKNVVYLATTDEKESEGVFTVGQSINLKNRLTCYNNNKLFNFKIVKYISCKSTKLMDCIEQILLCKFNKYKILSNRDVFQLPEGKDISFFTQWYDYLNKICDDIDENIVLEQRTEEEEDELLQEKNEERKEDKSIYNKTYREEHHEEILEREKDFREVNKGILRERTADYRFNNRDKINENQRIKAANDEEGKQAKKEYMKEYRQEKAEEIAASKKKYREEHKEVMEEKVNCVCGSTVSRQNLSYHLQTDRHKKFLETGKTVNEMRKESYVTCCCGQTISKRGVKRHETSALHKNFIESQHLQVKI